MSEAVLHIESLGLGYFVIKSELKLNRNQWNLIQERLLKLNSVELGNLVKSEEGILLIATGDAWIKDILDLELNETKDQKERSLELPICFDFAKDMDLNAIERIKPQLLNTEFDFLYFGFLPGFMYLTGLSQEVKFPRRKIPHRRVEPGSVGLITGRIGIYSMASPGGWNIIGRTPILLDPRISQDLLLSDISFYEISKEEFLALEARQLSAIEWIG